MAVSSPPSSQGASSTSDSSAAASSPISRLNNIASHIAPKMASTTNFPSDVVPQAPEDPLFGLMAAFRADESPDKVDLVSHCLTFDLVCPQREMICLTVNL